MSDTTLEQRREALEREIAQIREQYKDQPRAVIGQTSPDFLKKYTGMFADDPMFESVMRSIEERREQERLEAESEANEAEAAE